MYDLIQKTAAAHHLDILGGFHTTQDDTDLQGFGTVLLLGPREPGFWQGFTQDKEFQDGAANPIDRWSARVIIGLATTFQARPLFPFAGPPYQPFFSWALRSGRCHSSPINLLVHDVAGLFVSFRGALAFPQRFELPTVAPSPCLSCPEQPCQSACPVGAFEQGVYDVPACATEIRSAEQHSCKTQGCAARRVCPVSKSYGRVEAQSEFHMQVFLNNAP